MKLLIAIAVCLLPVMCFAQEDTVVTFSEIVYVQGEHQDQLFSKARDWMNGVLRNSKAMLQINDKESGELSTNCIVASYYDDKLLGKASAHDMKYRTKMSIWVKDGKYKFEMGDFDAQMEINESYFMFPGVLISSDSYPRKVYLKKKDNVEMTYRSMKKYAHDTYTTFATSLKKAMLAAGDGF